jgi:hypothetical protein
MKIRATAYFILTLFLWSCNDDKSDGQDNIYIQESETLNNGKNQDEGKNSFTIMIPEELQVLDDKIKQIKYSGVMPPERVFGNEDASVTKGLSLKLDSLNESEYDMTLDSYEELIKSQPGITFTSFEMKNINETKHGVLEFYSESEDGEILNIISMTHVNGFYNLIAFNCLKEQEDDWREELLSSLNSVDFKGKK